MKKGGCHCGLVSYEYEGNPLSCYACHCTDCQSASGTACTLTTVVFEAEVKLISGELSVNSYTRNDKEGHRHHCKNCGTTLWRSATDMPGIISISSGTFSDNSWVKPSAHLWVSSAQSWYSLNDNAVVFQEGATAEQLLDSHNEQN